MVRKLKDAIILSRLSERPGTKEEIAASMGIEKSNVARSIANMKKSGLIKGHGYYFLTNKGHARFQSTIRKISRSRP